MEIAKVIINEQHSLMPNQIELLDQKFGQENWERFNVPATGWTLEEQKELSHKLCGKKSEVKTVVFASPLPVMIMFCAEKAQRTRQFNCKLPIREVIVFHNDLRDKVELPNGKIIFTVAKTGWQLV
jgi:hypothetical protein